MPYPRIQLVPRICGIISLSISDQLMIISRILCLNLKACPRMNKHNVNIIEVNEEHTEITVLEV